MLSYFFFFCLGCILPLVFIKTKPKHNISGTQLKSQSHNHAGHLMYVYAQC